MVCKAKSAWIKFTKKINTLLIKNKIKIKHLFIKYLTSNYFLFKMRKVIIRIKHMYAIVLFLYYLNCYI